MRWLSPFLIAATLPIAGWADALGGAVEPGNAPVTSQQVAVMFQDICVETQPDFVGANAKLEAGPYNRAPETGTYFHPALNLSFKLFTSKGRERCSMVFYTEEDALPLAIMLGASFGDRLTIDPNTSDAIASLPSGATFEFSVPGNPGGSALYRALLTAPN